MSEVDYLVYVNLWFRFSFYVFRYCIYYNLTNLTYFAISIYFPLVENDDKNNFDGIVASLDVVDRNMVEVVSCC